MSQEKRHFDEIPFALSIGPQRSATSWIAKYLQARGDVCLPSGVKEVFFFDKHYDKGRDFYINHFQKKTNHRLIMEVSATYFDHKDAPERVKETLGHNLRLICPLREPISRSYSLYKHYVRYGIVSGTLKQAIDQKPQIVTSSFYSEHLSRWYEFFDSESIGILYQEDLSQSMQLFLDQLDQMLGLDKDARPDLNFGKVNPTTQAGSSILAAPAQELADKLRLYGLYWPINFAKKMGVKRLIFGKEDKNQGEQTIPENDQELLFGHLHDEKSKLE